MISPVLEFDVVLEDGLVYCRGFEVEIDDYVLPDRESGGEVSFGPFVTVWSDMDTSEVVTWATFVREYAAAHRISETKAEYRIEAEVLEYLVDYLED